MDLENLGYNACLEGWRDELNLGSFSVGRIISEHKERYIVKTEDGEFEGEIIGNLRYSAQNKSDFPAVGDWVAISEYDDKVLIHAVIPRKNCIERQAVGKYGEKQIVAANVDYALIVQAVDRDFNLNRVERYLTICYNAKVKPIIVLSKSDLISESDLNMLVQNVEERAKNVPVVSISNITQQGVSDLKRLVLKGKTYCMLGSSGVGKSSLINNFLGKQIMKTNTISPSTHKGRHVTSHRELFVLESGGIIIDNPGMREVGIADSEQGLTMTFDNIAELAKNCKFKNCTHINESGCAVIKAVEDGKLDKGEYENYLNLEREKKHFESTVEERKKKDKDLGKIIKNYKKGRFKY